MRIILTELAWAAGFFDGEGCTHAARKPRTPNLVVTVAVQQQHPEVIVRFADAIGHPAGCRGPYHTTRNTDIWEWSVTSGRAIAVLGLLWPYLGTVKQEQALHVGRLVDASRKVPR